MIEILVILLVLGAATVVFYPALAGTASPGPSPKTGGKAGAPVDEESAEQLAMLVEHRNRVLRNLAELDSERAAGRLAEADYRELKHRDELAAAKAIHELEAFQAEQTAGRRKGRGKPQVAPPAKRRLGPVLGWVGGTAAFAVILGITMARSVAPRAEGGTITGTLPGGGGEAPAPASPITPKADPVRLAQLEKTIKSDSSNLKNLLEAGHLYLAERRLDEAAQVTIKALSLDSEAPEGLAHIAMLLFAEGSSQQDHPDSAQRAFDAAVDAADRAVRAKPDLAEGWLFKGMIMMAGKHDPKGAAQAWEQYLKVAPPDADTTRIHAMVEAAKRAGAR